MPVAPKPAASVLLVRPGAATAMEVFLIRRARGMRFLGGGLCRWLTSDPPASRRPHA